MQIKKATQWPKVISKKNFSPSSNYSGYTMDANENTDFTPLEDFDSTFVGPLTRSQLKFMEAYGKKADTTPARESEEIAKRTPLLYWMAGESWPSFLNRSIPVRQSDGLKD